MKFEHLIIYSDGGSRGNPGSAAIGYVIYANSHILIQRGLYIGKATNNQAEYHGIKGALQEIINNNWQVEKITCYLDSELVVKQINGEYKIKNKLLLSINIAIKKQLQIIKKRGCQKIGFNHVKREKNKLADQLLNQVLDHRNTPRGI